MENTTSLKVRALEPRHYCKFCFHLLGMLTASVFIHFLTHTVTFKMISLRRLVSLLPHFILHNLTHKSHAFPLVFHIFQWLSLPCQYFPVFSPSIPNGGLGHTRPTKVGFQCFPLSHSHSWGILLKSHFTEKCV